ncbi:hypothetical protein DL764_003255 [Monosporascus ibericus]|uniref:F-box domain-containing protein n=1 Tax=Monosporascus ibericus TaxID=155417 RepID=A0A4Q4TH68_9PEZI|nr:hypothetical protein DL764_003255 [Monosporascus ibericus]
MTARRFQVLNTPELLEAILLKLDIRTVISSAQLVNRQWHDLITKSPAIQQAIFFKPLEAADGASSQNPLLTELFPPFFDGKNETHSAFYAFEELAMARQERLAAFRRKGASWRRMLVQQPPVRELGIWETVSRMGGDSNTFRRERYPEGLRMGELYDLMAWIGYRFLVFWSPLSSEALHGTVSRSRRLTPQQTEQLDRLADDTEAVLRRFRSVGCVIGRRESKESFEFRRKFSFDDGEES